MSISTRKCFRIFPVYRDRAERGGTVVIESREGVKFVFPRTGDAPRLRRAETPLSREITERLRVLVCGSPDPPLFTEP